MQRRHCCRASFLSFTILLFGVAIFPAYAMPEDVFESALVYVSDYFSFVGKDSEGYVAFALDNNRGRDGNAYQAEHFLVLHDERRGWTDVKGTGRYDNSRKELATIPDSSFFRFQGTPRAGMTIRSDINQLALTIDAMSPRLERRHDGAVTWMSSASAVLRWNGRTIPGRVIYEYVMMPNFNRLTKTYWGMWNQFQGLYLAADHAHDVYAHRQRSERLAPLIGFLAGFGTFDDRTDPMTDLKVEQLGHEWALGFYRWPTAWRITWTGARGPATLVLSQSQRKSIGNWVVGGFSMAIVQGDLDYGGVRHRIYGLAELIM